MGAAEAGAASRDTAGAAHGDAVVVAAVLQEGLGGRKHAYLEEQLIMYALPVLTRLILDEQILGLCARLGRPFTPGPAALARLEGDTVNELVADMIASGLPLFRRWVFTSRDWSPDKGASLSTTFVNACILQFPAKFKRWDRQREREVSTSVEDLDLLRALLNEVNDPETQVVTLMTAKDVLDAITDNLTSGLLRKMATGLSQAEAAEQMNMTAKAAEGRIGRARKRLRDRERRPGQEGEHA